MATGGGAYTFGVYSKALKASFGYDQKTLTTLSFFKNLVTSLGILPGLLNEVAPPWVLLLAGAAINLTGYLMTYLAVSGNTLQPPVWLMCVYVGVGANAQTFANAAALVTTVNSFPGDRGAVLGVLMGFAGLSGAIFTHLHSAFDAARDGAALLRLLAWLPTAVSLLLSLAVRIVPRSAAEPPARGEERRGVLGFLGVSLWVALYLFIFNVVELKVPRLPRPAYYVAAVTIVVTLICFLLAIVVVQEQRTYKSMQATMPTTPPSSAAAASDNNMSSWDDALRPPVREEYDYSILQALCSVDMLLLFAITIPIGGMLTAIDNMGQIGQSLGYQQRTVSLLVSLISVFNYAGRVVAGFGSEYMVARYKLPRPLGLTATLVVAAGGHLLIALGLRNGLYAASAIMGFCLGAQWTVLFATVSEAFGLKHFSTLCNLVPLPSAAGSYVLGVVVAGHLYDREAQRQARPDLTCVGVQCFSKSFEIIAGVTLAGAVVSAVLAWRMRRFYGAAGGTVADDVTIDTSHPGGDQAQRT